MIEVTSSGIFLIEKEKIDEGYFDAKKIGGVFQAKKFVILALA